MNIIIDPNLFKTTNQTCLAVMEQIFADMRNHHILTDNDEVARAYAELGTPGVVPNETLKKILKYIIGNAIHINSAPLEYLCSTTFKHCTQPVLPQLITMCVNKPAHEGCTLWMDSPRNSCLSKKQGKTIYKYTNVIVKFASQAYVYAGTNPTKFQSKLFEHSASDTLKSSRRHLDFYTKEDIKKNTTLSDVDVYIFSDDNNTGNRSVIVGECKLRLEGQTLFQIRLEEVEQLIKNIDKILSFEQKEHNVTQFQAYMISNADGINQDAEALAKKHGIGFLQCTLTDFWWQIDEWQIEGMKEILPACNLIETKTS